MNALDALSRHCGIVETYLDARGETRTLSPQTKYALLVAMGIDGTDESNAQLALDDLKSHAQALSLPPVHVHYQSSRAFKVRVVGKRASEIRGWRIVFEDGSIKNSPASGAVFDCAPDESAFGQCDLFIEGNLPLGYHVLTLVGSDARCALIISPGRCWLPPKLETGGTLWGVAAQLYLLRSGTNWGIGDYGDLKQLALTLKAFDADVIGLNPLHAMFPDDPEQASPYSPASRLLLNVLNIDVVRVAETLDCPSARRTLESKSFREQRERCRSSSLVDYKSVAALKFPLLHELFWCCDRRSAGWRAFLAFRSAAGTAFEQHCLFLSLRIHFANQAPEMADWHEWPVEYQSPDSPASIAFGQVHAEAVTFQAWVQFIADQQLRDCSEAASGMAIGLYRDLAVGAAADGAETWANAKAVVDSVHVGAPPDIHNPRGQDWRLPPLNPLALRAEGYQSFIELLRANMRYAGALRIDHVMALQQLYWIPKGHSPSDGGYVQYPLEDLVGILALESHRHQCLIVGEDLGTVPLGFRERMAEACVLSYRVLFFEHEDGAFIKPEQYPTLSVAVAGSHDLPTLRAWWQETDLELKRGLNLYADHVQSDQAIKIREADRAALRALLIELELVGSDGPLDCDSFAYAAHRLLSKTRSAIALLQLDDLTGEMEPVNVPTTSDEHPNWRRRHALTLDELSEDLRFQATIRMFAMRSRAGDEQHCSDSASNPQASRLDIGGPAVGAANTQGMKSSL